MEYSGALLQFFRHNIDVAMMIHDSIKYFNINRYQPVVIIQKVDNKTKESFCKTHVTHASYNHLRNYSVQMFRERMN